jgi:hypothetical protein
LCRKQNARQWFTLGRASVQSDLSGGDAEYPLDEALLSNNIAFRQPADLTFANDVHGLVSHTAIRKVRLALNDSPRRSTFIQTVSGKGYQFTASVTMVGDTEVESASQIVSVIVLPFENLTGDADQEYSSDGVMTCTGQSGSEYSYKSSFVGHPTADVTVSDIDQLTWAYETLECYSLTTCTDYPNTCRARSARARCGLPRFENQVGVEKVCLGEGLLFFIHHLSRDIQECRTGCHDLEPYRLCR